MKVLITDPLSEKGIDVLRDADLEVLDYGNQERDVWEKLIPEADGWIVRSGTQVLAGDLERAQSLRAIGRAGVGTDNIDIASATRRGIAVMNTPGGNTVSAAEHTIALMCSLARNIHLGHASLMAGRWDRKKLVGRELKGSTLGILGLGRIGQEVARRAIGMQMNVIGFDPFLDPEQLSVPELTFQSFEEVIESADILTLHLPKTAETTGLIGSVELQTMRPSAFIINCARGGIVDEQALAAALEARTIAGAAIDVFTTEPPEGNPLLEASHVLVTPHLGASTREAGENVATQVARQLRDFLLEGNLANAVNLPVTDMGVLRKIGDELRLAEELGRVSRHLVPDPVRNFRFITGMQEEYLRPLALSALKGLLQAEGDTLVNFINAAAIASDRGVQMTMAVEPAYSHIQNFLALELETSTGKQTQLAGYVDTQRGLRLFRVEDHHIDLLLDGHLLLLRNRDVPGVVGEVGSLLGRSGTNIAEYSLSRNPDQQLALSVIKTDSLIETETQRALAEIPAVQTVVFITASPEGEGSQ